MSEIGRDFGLTEGVAGLLATVIGATTISISDTGACQYNKAKEVLTNIGQNEQLYKYLPAIIYPDRVTQLYTQTYEELNTPTFGDLSIVRKIQSIMVRHGLLVSTQRNGETQYLYIGGIPEGFSMISRLFVSQGGALFNVKPYRSILRGININPRFGILPVINRGQYYTNPPINQGGNGLGADIVGIFNYMASTLSATISGTYFRPAVSLLSDGSYYTNGGLRNELNSSTSESKFADTPAIHITATSNLISPSVPDSTNFNPVLQTLYWSHNNVEFTKAIQGAPIYVSYTGYGTCVDLQLRGFVGELNPITGEFNTYIPGLNKNVVLSPGLAYGYVIQPPQSWNYDDLVNWAIANGMGLEKSIFDKWMDLALFESRVIQQLIARGHENLVNYVIDHFDPSPEVIEKGVDSVVNGIINNVSSGFNSVINFLKSL